MSSEVFFSVLVVVLAVQRLVELRKSRQNERWLRARGAREYAAEHFRSMQMLHVGWFIAMPLEVWLLDSPFVPWLAGGALAVAAIGQVLRYSAMRALGRRWSVRVWTMPGRPVVAGGIYEYLRHPNYLGVVLELASVPLIHGAWRSALVFSLLNALVLARRISEEERALSADSRYAERLGNRPRLVPLLRRVRGRP